MSKYDWVKFQRLSRRVHNLHVNKAIESQKSKNSNLLKYALIEPKDTAQLILNKKIYFWLELGFITKYTNLSQPESWLTKPGSFIPQLVVILRSLEKKRSGNYTLTIPHFTGSKNIKIPNYKKGNHTVTLVLRDASKIIVNAASEGEAKNLINRCTQYVRKELITRDFRHTERTGIDTHTLQAIRADFYPVGQGNSEPQWKIYF
jgi:hypothetical protein